MKCPKCGKEIANGSMFCEYCGAQVKKNRKPLFIAIAIVACLLIFGGIGLTMYNKGEQEQARIERELLMSKRAAAEAEAKAKAEHEARLKAEAEAEAKAKAEHEARLRAEQEAILKAEKEARLRAEQEAILKAEKEARLRAEQEAMRKQEDAQNAWKKECYIVDCGEYYLAVQKTPVYKYYNHDDAFTAVRASRVGGFEDWDLPTDAEIELIFDACGSEFKNGYYWTRSFGFWDDDDDSEYELKSLGLWEKGTRFLIYYYAFNSYKKKIYAVASYRSYKNLLKDSKEYNDINWFVIVRRFKK